MDGFSARPLRQARGSSVTFYRLSVLISEGASHDAMWSVQVDVPRKKIRKTFLNLVSAKNLRLMLREVERQKKR